MLPAVPNAMPWEENSLNIDRSGARGLGRLPCFKYFNVQKQESRFNVGLNTAENTHYIRKRFK